MGQLFVTKQRRQRTKGKNFEFYVLREREADPDGAWPKQRYAAYVGKNCKVSRARAEEIAEKASANLGREVTVDEIAEVLVVEDDPT